MVTLGFQGLVFACGAVFGAGSAVIMRVLFHFVVKQQAPRHHLQSFGLILFWFLGNGGLVLAGFSIPIEDPEIADKANVLLFLGYLAGIGFAFSWSARRRRQLARFVSPDYEAVHVVILVLVYCVRYEDIMQLLQIEDLDTCKRMYAEGLRRIRRGL